MGIVRYNVVALDGLFANLTPTSMSSAILVDTGGAANTYAIPVSTLSPGATLLFRALYTNTGASSLNTTASGGARPLVNTDGSALSASTILANAAVQVTWDGSYFVLGKRPFNDRVAVSASN